VTAKLMHLVHQYVNKHIAISITERSVA